MFKDFVFFMELSHLLRRKYDKISIKFVYEINVDANKSNKAQFKFKYHENMCRSNRILSTTLWHKIALTFISNAK